MRPASTAPERDRHGDGYVPSREEAVRNDRRQAAAWRRRQVGGGVGLQIDFFELFTELPLRLFCKLLTNFLQKLKISKNESCSTFQTLQLCLSEHFQILPPFLNLNLGCI